MESFFGLVNNAALMLVLCVIYDTFSVYSLRNPLLKDTITGGLVGLIAVIVMLTPWSLQPGVFFDTRWVMLSLCGLFFGFRPTVIAAAIAGVFRLYQGGAGGIVGTLVIVVTSCVGLLWRNRLKSRQEEIGLPELYLFGVVVQLAMLSCMVFMPQGMRIPILKAVSLPILTVYPVLTLFVGFILKKQEDRRRTENELIKNKSTLSRERGLLKGVINSIPDLIFFKDSQGRYLGCNKSFEEFTGFSESELTGKDDNALFGQKKPEIKVDDEHQVLSKHKPVSMEKNARYPDGREVIFNTIKSPFRDMDGNLRGLVSVSRDITDQRRADIALRDAFDINEKIIALAPIGISIYDKTGQCIVANDSIAQIIGATREEVLKQNYNEIASWKQSGMLEAARNALKTRKTGRLEINLTTSFNQKLVAECFFVPFYKEGEPHLMFMLTDMAERKKAEEEKIKAQQVAASQEKNALVGRVAGKIAHDFNNILGIVMGNTELALLESREANTVEILNLILEQTIRGKNLTKNLVAFAKDQDIKEEFFNISEKIELVLNLLKKDLQGIELNVVLDKNLPELLADPGMIEHTLVNLIQNAIHATGRTEYPLISIRTCTKDENIVIEVEDNGCGIPQMHLNDIYQPAFTLKGRMDLSGAYKKNIKGTGYGMANVKKYIEQHRGEIQVCSQVGGGTCFTVRLPISKRQLTAREKKMISRNSIQTRKNILVVEDETAISEVHSRILSHAPCHHVVDIAPTGQKAISMLDKNTYDCISLDYMLPDDLNGMDVYHHIRKNNTRIPVLFVSGNIEFIESLKNLSLSDPYISHLSKPYRNDEYIQAVNSLITKVQCKAG